MDDYNYNDDNMTEDSAAFDELESMFGQPENELMQMEQTSLSENLEGFASCFPSWDLHPPIKG